MSIFSAIRAGLGRIKSAISSVGSRIKSAVTGNRQTTTAQRPRVPGELFPQQPQTTQTPTIPIDDLRAPTTQEIKDAHFRYQVNHADTDLSGYAKEDVDTFYRATHKIWAGAEHPYQRNDLIREYFESQYGMSDLDEIFDFVTTGQVPESDDMIPGEEQEGSPNSFRMPTLYFG